MTTAILLASGGLDSLTIAATHPTTLHLTINYGQEHQRELRAAKEIAAHYRTPHLEIACLLPQERHGDIVPNRNAVLINIAASIAMARRISTVLIGCNAADRDDFPDCREKFLRAVNVTLNAAGTPVTIAAPLLDLTKPQIGDLARTHNAPTHLAWSCYHPVGTGYNPQPCGTCNACHGRKNAGV